MILADTHIHTTFSHDGKSTPEEVVLSGIKKGLSAVTITEHCDIGTAFYTRNIFSNIKESIKAANSLKEKYAGVIDVLCGFEIGESYIDHEATSNIFNHFGVCSDVILGSFHSVCWDKHPQYIGSYDFKNFSHADIVTSLDLYFNIIIEHLNDLDVDVLCHLTYPYRYINFVHGLKNYHYKDYFPQIKEILKIVAKRDLALEVNTSNIGKFPNSFYMVDKDILELFYDCGGRLVSLGSDAHIADNVGNDFVNAVNVIKSAGFNEYCYFKKRSPVMIEI